MSNIFINNHGIPAGGKTKKSFTNFNGRFTLTRGEKHE